MIHTWIGNGHYFVCKKPDFYMTVTVCIKKNLACQFLCYEFCFLQKTWKRSKTKRYYDTLIYIHGRFDIILQRYSIADTSFMFYHLREKKKIEHKLIKLWKTFKRKVWMFLIIWNRAYSSKMLVKITESSKSETYHGKISISIMHIVPPAFPRSVR